MNYLGNISLKKLITLIKTLIKTEIQNNAIEGDASSITYDGSSSGIMGENVQEAIDELAEGIAIEDMVFCGEEDTESTTTPLNADTVGGYTVDLLLDKIYPIGSIYMSLNSVDPATLFGGTWQQIKDTFLLAAGDSYAAGDVGGEAEHKLTVDEMPSHVHKFDRQQWYSADTKTSSTVYSWKSSEGGTTSTKYVGDDSVYGPTGGDKPHNNMPPYLAVFVWKRIS